VADDTNDRGTDAGTTGEEQRNSQWVDYLEPAPPEWAEHPRKHMLMTPWLVLLGGIFAFAVPTFFAAFFQTFFFNPPVSGDWAPLKASAMRGRLIYLANGCVYCHSGFNRPQDVRGGQFYLYPRASRPGDFATSDSGPNLFGSARIGPSLAQESGFHPDDWHRAHFSDPRFPEPLSIMPDFNFLTDQEMDDLIMFVQTQSGKTGLLRYAGQLYMKKLITTAQGLYQPPSKSEAEKLTLGDVSFLQVQGVSPPGKPQFPPENDSTATVVGLGMPDPINLFIVDRGYWMTDNPLPVTTGNLIRGRMIFQNRCIGCHGQGGSAVSLAARFMSPMPLPFSVFDDQANGADTSPGDFYYRILRGIPGTAMENFGTRLSVDDIWRVVLFLKTIPNGGLQADKTPSPEMYIQWEPPAEFLTFAKAFPAEEQRNFVASAPDATGASKIATSTGDPFILEAESVLNGMGPNDKFDLPGFGPVSLRDAANGIKGFYTQLLDAGYADYGQRGGFPTPTASQKAALPQPQEDLR